MAETRYLSFEETLSRLGMEEDDLLNLVAANEIRAFRIDREMKFKETDVSSMDAVGAAPPAAPVAPPPPAPAVGEESVVDLADGSGLELLGADEELAIVSPPEVSEPDDDTLQTVDLEDGGFDDEISLLEDEPGSGTEVAPTELAEDSLGSQTEEVLASTGSDGLGTEEIVFEDEDLAIGNLDDLDVGTQEVTVREDAISDQELTVMEDVVGGGGGRPSSRASGRSSSRRGSSRGSSVSSRMSGASMRRQALVEAGRARGNPIITGVLIITALAMLYPLTLFITIAGQGYSTLEHVNASGKWKNDNQVPSLGVVFIPKFLEGFTKWDVDNARPIAWWGDLRPKGGEPEADADGDGDVPEGDGDDTGDGDADTEDDDDADAED